MPDNDNDEVRIRFRVRIFAGHILKVLYRNRQEGFVLKKKYVITE